MILLWISLFVVIKFVTLVPTSLSHVQVKILSVPHLSLTHRQTHTHVLFMLYILRRILHVTIWSLFWPLLGLVLMMKERFAKLLLGEDMSGGAKGVSSALAISNAITNLSGKLEMMQGYQKKKLSAYGIGSSYIFPFAFKKWGTLGYGKFIGLV